MKIELNRLSEHAGRPLLVVTHSDRPMQEPKCDINYLEQRCADPYRLPPAERFEDLRPARDHVVFSGGITAYALDGDGHPELVCDIRPESYRPQHTMWHGGRLWVLGTDHIEVYGASLASERVVRDPWLAGNHTIAADGRGGMLVSCSASDSVLTIDERSGDVVSARRMPEDVYGCNYPLQRTDSVVDHYIVNDYQIAHVNCAWPWRGGVLVSSLIPGAVGYFRPDGAYHEIVRGFVGCHGARVWPDTGELYFSDSCSGMLMFLDPSGRILRRVGTGSRWLHDAVHVHDDLFALAAFDFNEVVLMRVSTRQVVARIPCGDDGGPQFLSFGG